MITALFLFGLFYATIGIVIAVAAFLTMKDSGLFAEYTKFTNVVANVVVVFLVFLSWPIWAGAWLARFV